MYKTLPVRTKVRPFFLVPSFEDTSSKNGYVKKIPLPSEGGGMELVLIKIRGQEAEGEILFGDVIWMKFKFSFRIFGLLQN